jgi:diguanylate cyclase (GGDEF)-like protein
VPETKTAIPDQTDLLESLKEYPFLAPYRLAIYIRQQVSSSTGGSSWHLHWSAEPPLSGVFYPDRMQQSLNEATSAKKPSVFTCPLGLINFIIPFTGVSEQLNCLVGSGVREEQLDLWQLESIVRSSSFPPIKLMEQLEDLPVVTPEAAAEVARRVQGLLPSVQTAKPQANMADRLTERLSAIAGISMDIDLAASRSAAVGLCSETISVLFDVSGVLIILSTGDGERCEVHASDGLSFAAEKVERNILNLLAPSLSHEHGKLDSRELTTAFPGIAAESAITMPLMDQKELLGAIILLEYDPLESELALVEIICGRLAARLLQLKKEDDFCREHTFSTRLLAMLGQLALVEESDEFLRTLLDMAAQLVGATNGSLMLLDNEHQILRIRATIGMNPHLAKSLTVKLGSGIAGKVAKNGQAMVVNDIAKDSRTTGQNRARFKTGSFISMPLKFKEHLLGVLNLSDKKSRVPFDAADLELLTTFTNHAAALLYRSGNQEKGEQLERLAVVDPLTELYNRRFMEQRLDVELSRSQRNKQQLTLLLIDMDNFKLYNDLCGRDAGDRALQKVSTIMIKALRDMDLVTRYNGGTFCILLPATIKRESIFVAERIRRNIEQEPFTGEEMLPKGKLTCSIGLATIPEDGKLPDELINAADSALAKAKSEGRNKICFPMGDEGG